MTNTPLAKSIKKAESIQEDLDTILSQMRQTQNDLSFEAVDALQAKLADFVNGRGEINFKLEIEFQAIQDDLFE